MMLMMTKIMMFDNVADAGLMLTMKTFKVVATTVLTMMLMMTTIMMFDNVADASLMKGEGGGGSW